MADDPLISRFEAYLNGTGLHAVNVQELGNRLQQMVNAGLDQLVLPGREETFISLASTGDCRGS
jgi:hypothetical protein